jgi:hypothetical protein
MWMNKARLLGAASLLLLQGCGSKFVETSIENDSGQPLRVVELDYPGAGFGTSTLAPRAVYHYRFKALGSGALSLSYTDASGAAHTAAGPVIEDAQGGTLVVHIGERGAVTWQPALSHR